MNTLFADSTNQLLYAPSVGELSSAPVVTATDLYGNPLALSGDPEWSSDDSAYKLVLAHTEITSTYLGQTLRFEWEWTHDSQVLTDVEIVVVVENGLGGLIPTLRRKLKDTGDIQTYDFILDGISTAYVLPHRAVKPGSQLVIVNQETLDESAYGFDYGAGRIVFSEAHTAQDSARIIYVKNYYTDWELNEYLVDAIKVVNSILSTSYSTTDPAFSNNEDMLVTLIALREVYQDEMAASAGVSFDWRDEEKQMNKGRIVSNYKDAIALLEEKIRQMLREIYMTGVGASLSGGGVPITFDAIDWTTLNA